MKKCILSAIGGALAMLITLIIIANVSVAREQKQEKIPYEHNFSENRPKHTFPAPVMDERGNQDLPPGTKGGETMKPDLHETHKQHTFDSFCKKVLQTLWIAGVSTWDIPLISIHAKNPTRVKRS